MTPDFFNLYWSNRT